MEDIIKIDNRGVGEEEREEEEAEKEEKEKKREEKRERYSTLLPIIPLKTTIIKHLDFVKDNRLTGMTEYNILADCLVERKKQARKKAI